MAVEEANSVRKGDENERRIVENEQLDDGFRGDGRLWVQETSRHGADPKSLWPLVA